MEHGLTKRPKLGVWEAIEYKAAKLAVDLGAAADEARDPAICQSVGTMLTFFAEQPVTNWATVAGANTKTYGVFFQAKLEGGTYLAPSQFKAKFI